MKTISHEIIAGLTTFFTMSYVLILLPKILSAGGLDFGTALAATVLTLAFATLLLAFSADYPMVIGPGVGIAAFLIYSIVGKEATIDQVLGLVFWAGLIEFLLSITGLRQKILIQIPDALKRASKVGIGLFFIIVGIKQLLGPIGMEGLAIGIVGILFFALFHRFAPRFAYVFPILICWMLSLFFNLSEWKGLISLPRAPHLISLDLLTITQPELWGILLSTLLIALFDAGAGLSALSHLLGWKSPPKFNRALLPDGLGSMLGAFLGTTSSTFYAESSSGIRAGGRTGIVGCTAAICALFALFFYPALSSIPLFATAPTLVGLGSLLALDREWLEWRKWCEWIPFCVTALAMPIFFNIYLGFALGFISYVLVHVLSGRRREIHPVVWGLAAIFVIHLSLTQF